MKSYISTMSDISLNMSFIIFLCLINVIFGYNEENLKKKKKIKNKNKNKFKKITYSVSLILLYFLDP